MTELKTRKVKPYPYVPYTPPAPDTIEPAIEDYDREEYIAWMFVAVAFCLLLGAFIYLVLELR